ncbi:hypothetical protein BH10BAC2_BH10BAC2_20450 [soil metagenome]
MKNISSIQLKATLLLLVFSMNTIIGFACSVGMDMGFNTTHHHQTELTDSKSHHHNVDADHHHDEADTDHHSKDSKDNCCKDKVIKFAQVDKSVPQSANNIIQLVFFTAFSASFFDIDISFASKAVPNVKYFVRSYHPPIPDIRIAIQSFQI